MILTNKNKFNKTHARNVRRKYKLLMCEIKYYAKICSLWGYILINVYTFYGYMCKQCNSKEIIPYQNIGKKYYGRMCHSRFF